MNAPHPNPATSPAKQPAFPERWIEELFDRMAAMYGAKFADQWRGIDPAKVRAMWAEKLAGFADKPQAIKSALDALDERPFPPTLPEFLQLCREAAKRVGNSQPALPLKPDPERAKAASARLMAQLTGKAEDYDPLLWAKRPKSQKALDFVIDGAKRSEPLRQILADLKAAGVCSEAGKLLKRYKGQNQWVAA